MKDIITNLDLATLRRAYRKGRCTPRDVIDWVCERRASLPERNEWITRLSFEQLEPWLDDLSDRSPGELPLYGIPFAIKDNIDLAGVPTTAACSDYSYVPERSAFVVQKLIDAGAIPMGKTNLDQFATGLVGTRSPYGACRNSFHTDYISGGSSSGSAVTVATGQVSFSLGTDTAGSGRVPAAFNNLVGLKPTRGLLSTSGVVPACRSLDCVSVFAKNTQDACQVLKVCSVFDRADAFARPLPLDIPSFGSKRFRFGRPRPEQLAFFGNVDAELLFDQAVERLRSLGGEAVSIDFEPFLEASRLLYEGPWLTERYVAIEQFIQQQPDALYPVTREIISQGRNISAVDAFKAQYRLMECRRHSEKVLEDVDLVLTPTAGTIFTLEQVEQQPVRRNSELGYYTNFMNLLDLAAVAVPAGFQKNGLPFGVTLFSKAFADHALLSVADRLQRAVDAQPTAAGNGVTDRVDHSCCTTDAVIPLAVCGAQLSGLALNSQLTERGAWLMESTCTAPAYRLYALAGGAPLRPGLVRESGGVSIEVEVWAMPRAHMGGFLAAIPAPLGLGKVELADGREVTGFICEPRGVVDARDISAWGGWRAWLNDSAK
jgi:allophanate hydrolase